MNLKQFFFVTYLTTSVIILIGEGMVYVIATLYRMF